MKEEFVSNQEWLKPWEDKNEEDRSKVDDFRGSPMSVENLEELIDEKLSRMSFISHFSFAQEYIHMSNTCGRRIEQARRDS